MPSKTYVKTYSKAKKINSKYIPKPTSPFRITEASMLIDNLLSRNIKKRKNLQEDENVIKKKIPNKRQETSNLNLPEPVFPSLLTNDSFDIKTNSTFDDLLKGPQYNNVNFCNKTSFYVDSSSTDTSNLQTVQVNVEPPYNTRKRVRKNYAVLHTFGSNNSTIYNSGIVPKGKIKKKKNNASKKIKTAVKKVISDVSKNKSLKKQLNSYLDKSINYSLIIDKKGIQNNSQNTRYSYARKFTPISATSKLLPNYLKNDSVIFQPGFRHLMRADNTPKYIHSSTPIVTRNIKVNNKLVDVSPITAIARSKLNFTDNSKSLFESKKLIDNSSIQNTSNINKNECSIILISSVNTDISNFSDKIAINKSNTGNNNLLKIENKRLSKKRNTNCHMQYSKERIFIDDTTDADNDDDKLLHESENCKKYCDFLDDTKLNAKAIVLIENNLDILGINGKVSLMYNLNKLSPSHVYKEPVIHIERLSMSAYKNPNISMADNLENSKSETKINKCNLKQCHDKNLSSQISTQYSTETEISKEKTPPRITNSPSNTKKNSNSHLLENKNIRTSLRNFKRSVNSKQEIEKNGNNNEISNKSLFSPENSDVIIDNTPVANNFVTKRKKRVQINIHPVNESITETSTNNRSISLPEWEKFTQSRIHLVRIDEVYKDLDCFKTCSNTNKIIDTCETHENSINKNLDFNRKSIYLKPGKKWFRSLSILRRTNVYEVNNDVNTTKGRKWRDSIHELFQQQENKDHIRTSHAILNNAENIRKYNIRSNVRSLDIRKSLKIVNISVIKDSSKLEETKYSELENKSGYVSTLADVSILESFDKLSLITNTDDREETARQIILKRCGQTAPISFDDCYSSRILKKCRKIGEGVYGEVFMYKSLDNKCRVMKIIPIEGSLVVNGEHQKKFEEIISEIIIASELSSLRVNKEFCTNGFAELLQIYCVKGKYPQHLIDLWDLYDEDHGSENDSPEIFPEDQLYIILELENGGQDLEAYRFSNAEQSYALFVQVVCSLAVAESALQFEHRDMHWGNILISPTEEVTTTFKLNGREFEVATKGVKVSIIDFTLSRMTYNNCHIFNDLSVDPDLFTATGDYQFDIYRLMRQRNLNDWQNFEPYTNILWLDYTLEKMINHLRYLRTTTKTHKTFIRRLSQIRKKILNFNSATELLNSDVFSHVFL